MNTHQEKANDLLGSVHTYLREAIEALDRGEYPRCAELARATALVCERSPQLLATAASLSLDCVRSNGG